ncbi:hypothetical protein C8R46DRAFT_1189333 [Mycena filopes]|nr:hypothetical protein C8R46DRAFT_1189333 [Mycena filopes]
MTFPFQPTSPPVPTSVLDYRAIHESDESQNAGISPHSTTLARRTSVAQLEEQQRPPQSASAHQFSADARFAASSQRPVAYSHGYPTPPSHLAALSPVNDPHSQSRAVAPPMVPIPPSRPPPITSQGPSQQPQRRPSASFQNPAPYPTPPTHSTALSPDQQRSPMGQPPPPLFGMFPPPPSTPTETRPPHLSHAPLPQSHIAFPPAANSSVPRSGPRAIAPYPQRPSDMPQAQGSVRRNSSTSQQHQQQQQHHQHHHHSQQQQRPMPSAHASTSHQPPPPPVPVPVPFPQPHTIQTTSFASPYSICSSSSAAVPGSQLAYHHELERRVHWHEAERSTLQAQLEKTRAEFDAYAQHAVGMNGGLRAERDAARQDAVRLRGLRDAARTDAAEQARLVKAMEVNEQGYQKKAVEMEAHSQHLAGLARRWEQTTRQLVTHVARLRAERGALQARVEALEAAAARGGEVAAAAAVADVAPGINNIIPKTEPVADEDMNAVDVGVKPEPLDDDLELQIRFSSEAEDEDSTMSASP